MNNCGRVLKGFRTNFRELEANIADFRTELNKTWCRCSNRRGDINQEHISYTLHNSSILESGRYANPFEFATVAPVVSQSPECTPCTQSNFFAQNVAEDIPSPMQSHPQEDRANLRFKPMNLPKFDPKGNVHTFL